MDSSAGLDTIDNGDGTWSYDLPDYLVPGDPEFDGIIWWVYIGQARHSYPGADVAISDDSSYLQYAGDSEAPLTATVRTDRFGRQWLAESIDETAWLEKLMEYEESLEAEPQAAEVTLPAPEGWADLVDHDWAYLFCDEDSWPFDPNAAYLYPDSREWVGSSPDTREVKGVFLTYDDAHICSGVMVDDDTALTAAHCMVDDAGNELDHALVNVCAYQNRGADGRCRNVADLDVYEFYDGGHDQADDFALVHLESGLSVGWMALSTVSAPQAASYTQYSVQHPGYVPGSCDPNQNWTYNTPANSTPYRMRFPYVHEYTCTGSVTADWGDHWGTTIPSSDGASGAPVYYFPTSGSTLHYLSGILVGGSHFTGFGYNHVVQAEKFRYWVIINK